MFAADAAGAGVWLPDNSSSNSSSSSSSNGGEGPPFLRGKGQLLPGGVVLLSLSEALEALHQGEAVALLHATPLGELLSSSESQGGPPDSGEGGPPDSGEGGPPDSGEGRPLSVLEALPWLLEADADTVLPLSPFYKRRGAPECEPRDPRDEFAALSAAAAAAAAETRRLFLMPDDEL